ncbi:MAG: multidrug ABC transporter ATP-binding protein, partial [Polaromonas sp.]
MGFFKRFENLLHAYPEGEPTLPPKGFMAFIWACSRGARGYILLLALLSAAMSAFEALMFAMLGRIIDWLGKAEPARLWTDHGSTLTVLAWIVVASIFVVALQTIVKHQTIAINFPMRLRWNFHRLMLGQSMAFYQDEFAGRLTTKVMQTALAVRDTLFVLADVLVAMAVYVATMT